MLILLQGMLICSDSHFMGSKDQDVGSIQEGCWSGSMGS